MKKILIRTSLVLLLVFGMAANAAAIQINGAVSFSGTAVFDNLADLRLAKEFTDFTSERVDGAGVGDYVGLTNGMSVAFTPFMFDPAPTSIEPLWTVTVGAITYSFDATGLTIFSRAEDTITLKGPGMAHITGFDDTPGTWNISANRAGTTASFSSSAEVAPVPEPLTLILLGSGLLGLVGLRRKLS